MTRFAFGYSNNANGLVLFDKKEEKVTPKFGGIGEMSYLCVVNSSYY